MPIGIPAALLISGAAGTAASVIGAEKQGAVSDAQLGEQQREFNANLAFNQQEANLAAARKAALVQRESPFVNMGQSAEMNLSNLMGLSPSTSPAPGSSPGSPSTPIPPQPVAPSQPLSTGPGATMPSAPSAPPPLSFANLGTSGTTGTTGPNVPLQTASVPGPLNAPPLSGGMVNMRAPDGQVQPVPAGLVAYYKTLGAVLA